jgi:tetratricopeptide (TPR) repeat protein
LVIGLWRRLTPVLLPVAACGLMLVPSAVRNYVVAKEVVLVTSGGGEVFYMAYAPESLGYYYCPKFVRPSPFLEHDDFRAEASRRMQRPLSAGESSRFWFREALSLAVRHPLRTMELVARKTAILFNDFEVPDSEDYSVSAEFAPLLRVLPSFGWLVGFGAIGIVLSLRWSMTSHATNRCWLPLGFVAAHALFVVVVYNFGRFRLGMMPVWMLFAAQGLSWLIMATRSVSQTTRWQAACGWVVALALSGVALIPPPGYVQAEFPYLHGLTRKQLQQREQDQHDVTALREELARQSDSVAAHQAIAAVLLRLGLKSEAIQHFERTITLRPDDSTLRLEYAIALEDILLDDRQAAEQLEAAVRLDPQTTTGRSRLAAMFIRQKRFAEAKTQFTELIRLQPESAEHHYNLANLLQADGQIAEAVLELHAAITRKTFFPEADRLLQKIVKTRVQFFDNAMFETAAATFETLSQAYRRAGQNDAAATCDALMRALKHRARQ